MVKPATHHFLEERLAGASATEFGSLEVSERMSLPKTWDQFDEIASNLFNFIEKFDFLPGLAPRTLLPGSTLSCVAYALPNT